MFLENIPDANQNTAGGENWDIHFKSSLLNSPEH